jgi:hypothetical protein
LWHNGNSSGLNILHVNVRWMLFDAESTCANNLLMFVLEVLLWLIPV